METIEIIREARKAGMQTALIMFGMFLIVSLLFGFYIYQSYKPSVESITQTQDGIGNHQEMTNGETITNS